MYVVNGQLTWIIDWGDAEIIQLYREMLGCNKALLRVFLDACD
ncbi:MAG TPA: hypothetical protein VKM54_13990 [Myxococcota bacterium]|nr:hypothetical protein [Myxococcota bacterium]